MTDISSGVPADTRLGRVALRVDDRDAAVAFYRDVVGLSVRTTTDTATTLGADGTALLDVTADESLRPRPRDSAGLFHTAFVVPDRAALAGALGRIREEWTLSGASDHGFSEALYCTDPEGNGVEIYRDTPRSTWPRHRDGRLEAPTRPLDLDALADAGPDALADADPGATVPPETRVGHVHLEGTSLADARAFYGETLGLDVTIDTPSALFFAADEYHHHLAVNTWNGRSRPAAADARGLDWFELQVPDEEALAAVRERLVDEETTDVDGGIAVTGPDGIGVRLVAAE